MITNNTPGGACAPRRIAIFASGNGSNAEQIVEYFRKEGRADAEVALIVCNRAAAPVLQRAERLGVPALLMTRAEINDEELMLHRLDEYAVDYIVLAGFLLMIPQFLLRRYPGRIINIHPSLLPKFGGKGMYGRHVHEAVVAAGESVTGITIHFVSEECDGGEIIFQAEVPVDPTDTADDVERKIHILERVHYPGQIHRLITGRHQD